jgi:radical SAM superfamily enzyme YgiQ (UPF0313 family)
VSIPRAVAEVESLARDFGPLTFYWADEIFFFTRANRLALCRELARRQLPVKWIAQLRADNLDDQLAEAMAEAGCTKVCLGGESGSDHVLKVASKHLTVRQVESAIVSASRAGLRVKTWWMVGLPGGDFADQLTCLDVIDKARPQEVAIHTFVPLPGTPFWRDSARYGITLPNIGDLENLYYYGSPDDVRYEYLTSKEMWTALEQCSSGLEAMGYVATDVANENSEYVFTSPLCRTTFTV